jgi:hypothetical protein
MSVKPRGYDLAEQRFHVRPRGPVTQNPMVDRYPEPLPLHARRKQRMLRALLICLLVAIAGALAFLGCPEPDTTPAAWSQALDALKRLDTERDDPEALAALGTAITRVADCPAKAGLVAAYALCSLDAGRTEDADRAFGYLRTHFPDSPYRAVQDAESVSAAWETESRGMIRAVRVRAWRAEAAAWCRRVRTRLEFNTEACSAGPV